jgi:hypothetical protein
MADNTRLYEIQTEPMALKLSKTKLCSITDIFAKNGIEFSYDDITKEETYYPIDPDKEPQNYDFHQIEQSLHDTGCKKKLVTRFIRNASACMYASTLYEMIKDITPLHIYTDIMADIITQGGLDYLSFEQLSMLKRIMDVDTVLSRFPSDASTMMLLFLRTHAEDCVRTYWCQHLASHPDEHVGFKLQQDIDKVQLWNQTIALH